MDIAELKEWLRIDDNSEDATLLSLLLSSKLIIKQSTGVAIEDLQGNEEALELYKTIQKMICTDLYENRDGASKINYLLTSLCIQLRSCKNKG